MTTRKTNARKTNARNAQLQTVRLEYIERGELLAVERPVTKIESDDLRNFAASENKLDDAFVDALMLGLSLPFASGSEFIKSINAVMPDGVKQTKRTMNALVTKVSRAARVREQFGEKPLAPVWHAFVASIDAENKAARKADPKAKITPVHKPTINALLKLVKPAAEPVDAFAEAFKLLTRADELLSAVDDMTKAEINAHSKIVAALNDAVFKKFGK